MPAWGTGELGRIAGAGQLTGPVQIHLPFLKQASELPRQNPHMQQERMAAGDPCLAFLARDAKHQRLDARAIDQNALLALHRQLPFLRLTDCHRAVRALR